MAQIKWNVKKSSSKNILPIQVGRLTDWDGLALFAGFSDCHRVHLALLSTHCKSSPIFHNLIASSGISTKIIVVIIVKSSPWSLILNPSLFSLLFHSFNYYIIAKTKVKVIFRQIFSGSPWSFSQTASKIKRFSHFDENITSATLGYT